MHPSLAGLDALSEMIDGGIPADRELRAARALLHASVTVRHAAGQPDGWLDDDGDEDFPVSTGVPDALVMVTLEAAKRKFLNPAGYQSETMGDYAYQVSGSGGTYLTAEERAMVEAAGGVAGASSSTIRYQLAPAYRHALRPRRHWGC